MIMDQFYKPNGTLQGDSKSMPDRGTSTGSSGDTYGADTNQDATNSTGKIGGASKSDASEQRTPERTAGK